MRIKIKIFWLTFISTFFIVSCSSSDETQTKNQDKIPIEDTVFVFDELPPEDLYEFESPTPQPREVYVVQIGAFSNIKLAKDFADQNRIKLNKDIKVEYKPNKNLYVVWIYPPFQDKESAIIYRSQIQNGGEFSDAWITTIDAKK